MALSRCWSVISGEEELPSHTCMVVMSVPMRLVSPGRYLFKHSTSVAEPDPTLFHPGSELSPFMTSL
jgi:hypothetical protein